jgi:flagellar biosynthesis chaperone FliJ
MSSINRRSSIKQQDGRVSGKFIVVNELVDNFAEIIKIKKMQNTSQRELFSDALSTEKFVIVNKMIDNLADRIKQKKTTSDRNAAERLVDLYGENVNSSKKVQNLIEKNFNEIGKSDTKLENAEEQAKRIIDLLAIIFNSYRTIDTKNKVIKNLKLKLEKLKLDCNVNNFRKHAVI